MVSALILLSSFQAQVAGTVEVPFRIGDSALIVDAKVNNRPVSLMFDTGYSGAVVVDSGIDIGKATGTVTLRDFVGELQAPTVKLQSIVLGSKVIPGGDMLAIQQPAQSYSIAYGIHCDGIMGFEVIKSNITQFNFEKKKLVFYPKSYDISKMVPDNVKTFLVPLLPIGHNSMEMQVTAPNGKKMTMALDTGNAFYATTHKDVLERVGIWDGTKTPKFIKLSGVASGAVESWSLKMPEMKIFGVPVKNSVWDIIDLPSSSAEGDGTVGFGFLHNFNITIDYERRRIWLEKYADKVENDFVGDVGISAGYDERAKRTRIYRVAPDSPAEAAGIKENDEILSIDGTDMMDFGFRRIRKMLEGPPDSTISMAISHNGQLKRVQLKRVPMYNE